MRGVFAIAAAASLLQLPVFRSAVDAVQVDVEVTRRSRPVAGLTAADFELLDSGVPQQIRVVAIEELPLHLLLALDTSGSMHGQPLDSLKEAAHAAVASLRPQDQMALLTFSQVLLHAGSWSSDAKAIDETIDRLQGGGATALYDAAFAAIALREHVSGRMLVLLFTDGVDTASWLSPLSVLDDARRTDVVVEAVRFESAAERANNPNVRDRAGAILLPAQRREWFLQEPSLVRPEFLGALADDTGGELLVTTSSRNLRAAFVKIIETFKTRYVLTYSPANVPASGWHPIEVRLRNQSAEVRARRGYTR